MDFDNPAWPLKITLSGGIGPVCVTAMFSDGWARSAGVMQAALPGAGVVH